MLQRPFLWGSSLPNCICFASAGVSGIGLHINPIPPDVAVNHSDVKIIAILVGAIPAIVPVYLIFGLTAQRRVDHHEQIVVVNRFVEKRHGAAARGPLLVFGVFAAGDDDDGNFFSGVQPLKPFHDTKAVPRHTVHGGNPMSSRIKSGFSLRAAATASAPSNAVKT